jgi:hypothetical protein
LNNVGTKQGSTCGGLGYNVDIEIIS